MTPEEKREKILKQLLPMLAVMVIYFIFISNIVTKKTAMAEKAYNAFFQKGVSRSALPSLSKESDQLNKEIRALRKKDEEIKQSFMQESIFSSHDSANATIERVSYILDKFQLRVLQESTLQNVDPTQLSKSLRDTHHWLKDVLSIENSSVKVIRIHFLGSYQNTFNAMLELSSKQIKSLPVSLSMLEPSEQETNAAGQMQWILQLWV